MNPVSKTNRKPFNSLMQIFMWQDVDKKILFDNYRNALLRKKIIPDCHFNIIDFIQSMNQCLRHSRLHVVWEIIYNSVTNLKGKYFYNHGESLASAFACTVLNLDLKIKMKFRLKTFTSTLPTSAPLKVSNKKNNFASKKIFFFQQLK